MKNIWKALNLSTRAEKILSTFGSFVFKVIRAWWYFFSGKNKELMKGRLSICGICELRKWKVCGACGCPLFAKSSDPEEHCPHPSMDKWMYIDHFHKIHPLKTEIIETRSDL